jgi:hypothetical protein
MLQSVRVTFFVVGVQVLSQKTVVADPIVSQAAS